MGPTWTSLGSSPRSKRQVAQDGVLACLHDLGLIVLDMVVTQQVQHAVHEHQSALIGGAVAKAGRLAGNDLRGQDDIAELERLVGGNVLVKGRVTFKREHVGGAIDATPLEIKLVHLVLIDIRKGNLDLTLNTLGGKHNSADVLHLLGIEQRIELGIVADQYTQRDSFRSCARRSRASSYAS